MTTVNAQVVQRLSEEIRALKTENEELLAELENAYAQLTAVMQVSQDETRIAYSELQEKVVVLEKRLFELDLLSNVGGNLVAEVDLNRLRRLLVEKICLILPVDLAALHLVYDLRHGTHRERDMVFEKQLESADLEKVRRTVRGLENRSHQPMRVVDFDTGAEHDDLRLRVDARSAAALPLRASQFLGVLILNSRLRANFRVDQEPLLGAFASQASAALENALRVRRLEDVLLRLIARYRLGAEALHACGDAVDAGRPDDALRQAVRVWVADGGVKL
ncbi:MAG: GAF domain-containing protein [Candidatus Krumholzibacteriia bacterium]